MSTAFTPDGSTAESTDNKTPKLSSAQEFNLLKKEHQRKVFEAIPHKHHKLYDMLKGQHPFEMAHSMADSFEEFYPQIPNARQRVLVHLYPEFFKKKRISFDTLNERLASLEEWFSENSPCLDLVESYRHIFTILPKPKQYYHQKRLGKKTAEETFKAKEIEQQWQICRHCWRRVYRYPHEKGPLLCDTHNYLSTSNEYRQRDRLREKAIVFWLAISKSCSDTLRELKNEKGPPVLRADIFTFLLCRGLPNLWKYLRQKGKSNIGKYNLQHLASDFLALLTENSGNPLWEVPLDEQQQYITANIAPGAEVVRMIVDILDPPPKAAQFSEARERFVERLTWNFGEYLDYLYLAEAWLVAEKQSQHGGKRKGAGRKSAEEI